MTASASAGGRPVGKRVAWFASAAMTFGVLLICLAFVRRGTAASGSAKNPSSVADGTLCQLFVDPTGNRPVRCAAVLDAKPEAVWGIVTDYARFGEIFDSKLWHVAVTTHSEDPDGRQHLVGRVIAPFAEYPFDVRIKHEVTPERSVASWDENDGAGNTTRGSWTVAPLDGGRTLLVYQQEVHAKRSPTFIINNLLLAQLGSAVLRVSQRVTPAGKP